MQIGSLTFAELADNCGAASPSALPATLARLSTASHQLFVEISSRRRKYLDAAQMVSCNVLVLPGICVPAIPDQRSIEAAAPLHKVSKAARTLQKASE
ncbi:TPA: hypothetical protein NJT62_000362 [Corynebacterium striatum]|nr:hypothetical protein [Corynebacterium striatum]